MDLASDLSRHARIGLVYHMLYGRCMNDPEYHVRTLEAFSRRSDMETFDCCLPYGKEYRERAAQAVRTSGKEKVVFATHLFPLRKLSFCSSSYLEQAQARILAADMVSQAVEMKASGFIFASGGPSFAEGGKDHHAAFLDFCRWLCEQLAPHGIEALLEPFDFDFDKKFLYGPLERSLELAERLSQEFPNFGIELDVAHLPLMREGFASSIRHSAPWLRRVHLGNCVLRNVKDPFYGDKHPPIGYPGGEIDVPELVEILSTLKEVGYLSPQRRGDLVLELNPFPGQSEDDSVADNMNRLIRAWSQAQAPAAQNVG